MNNPDRPARKSKADSGEMHHTPSSVLSLVMNDQDDNPEGLLEKWSSEAWIYADTDDLIDLN